MKHLKLIVNNNIIEIQIILLNASIFTFNFNISIVKELKELINENKPNPWPNIFLNSSDLPYCRWFKKSENKIGVFKYEYKYIANNANKEIVILYNSLIDIDWEIKKGSIANIKYVGFIIEHKIIIK